MIVGEKVGVSVGEEVGVIVGDEEGGIVGEREVDNDVGAGVGLVVGL